MKLIIPLAGKGTRLRPHTLTRPKPLLMVAGKPVLDHILDTLSGLNFSEVIFITGHLKEKVEAHIRKTYKFKSRFIEQTRMDGTAGAIRLTKDFVDEDILILYADTIFKAELDALKKARSDKGISGLIWVKEVDDYSRFGIVVTDKSGFMQRIVEKPKEPLSRLANIGLYYVKDYKLLFDGIEHIYRNNLNSGGEYWLTDAFQYMIDNGARIRTAPVHAWYDCGKFETLLETNHALLKENSRRYSRPRNSIIIGPVFIGRKVIIENSIIGPDVSIGDGTQVRGSIIVNSIIDINDSLVDIKIKDSIIGENAVVKGQFKKLNVGDYSELHFH